MIGFLALVFSLNRSPWFFLLLLPLLLNLSLQVSRYGPGELRFASGYRIAELQKKATAGSELLTDCAVTAMLESHSRQSLNSFSCTLGEYWSNHLCCKLCPEGTFAQMPCTIPHTQGRCETCPPGSFSRSSNGLSSCMLCSTCTKDQEMVAECSATRDRVCQCQTGHYYYDPDSPESCLPCTKCPRGIPVLQECSPTSDTVCSRSTSNSRNWLFLLFFLFLGYEIIAV